MKTIKNTFMKLFLWGIVCFLVLVLGFGVEIEAIFDIAGELNSVLSFLCIYYLASFILYPLLFFISYFRKGEGLFDIIIYEFPPFIWMPYRGIDIIRIRQAKYDDDAHLYLLRFVEMIIWWALAITAIIAVFYDDNVIHQTINVKNTDQKLIVLGIILGIYFIMCIISWLCQLAYGKYNQKRYNIN